ncbi:hypothetical protein ACWIWK_07110 [Helicobacter sp. 23-1048]
MKDLSKILVILCLCFLANAVADDEISLERLEQIKKEQNEYWLQFLAQALYYNDSPDVLARLAFAKKHFMPLWYEIITNDKGQKVARMTCFDNTAEKFCPYRLKVPIKLKGTLTIKTNYGGLACDTFFYTAFENEDLLSTEMEFLAYSNLQIKPTSRNQKEVLAKIPKWLLDGFAGEVKYEVEFEVANMSGYISDVWDIQQQDIALIADYSACGSGSYLVADNIKFIKKLSKKMDKNAEIYLVEYSEQGVRPLTLKTNDDFVNLRESPNGAIIARIYKKDFSDSLVIKFPQTRLLGLIDMYDKEAKWHKVIYFPPNTSKTKDAKAGFIHKSQIDFGE